MSRVRGPLIDFREGEAGLTVRAFLLLTLLIGGHTLLETARDALFLGKLSASRLPIVYVIISALAVLVAGPNARFVRRFGESRALVMTLMAAAYGTTLLYLVQPTPAVVFAIYVWSAFLATIMVVQFWMFLAQVFTPSQAKRLFGPIAAGGVIGAIAGAGAAAAVLTFVPVRSLLAGAAGVFVVAGLLSTTIDTMDAERAGRRGRATSADPRLEEPSRSLPPPPDEPQHRLAELVRDPYLRWLAALTALSTATVLGTDYLFKAGAARHVAPEDLGEYFARCCAVFNGAALVVQLVISGPLVRRAGVARALPVMPALLLTGSMAVLLTGAPAAVLLTKGVDGALRHSMHRMSSELMTLPIPPDVRARAKPALDGALTRAVQAMMGGLILLLVWTGHTSPRELAALVAVLALGWIAVAIGIRRPHLDMFRKAIPRGSLDAHRPAELDMGLIKAIVEVLSSPEPARAIAAMDLLVESGGAELIGSEILSHGSAEVQVYALGLMGRSARQEWAPAAASLLEPPSPERVRVAAVRALAAVSALGALPRCLADESPAVRAYAAVALAGDAGAGDAMTSPAIREIVEAPGEQGRLGRLALLDAIHDSKDPRFSGVILALLDPDNMDRAVLAMASVPDRRFIPYLVERLHVRSVRVALRSALVELGEPAQEALERAMRSRDTRPAVRLHIPRTLSRFGNQRAADFLLEQLAIDASGLVRYKLLRGLGELVASTEVTVDRDAVFTQMRRNLIQHFELLALWVPLESDPRTAKTQGGSLVLGLLSDKLRQSLERVFRLLHLAHRREDIRRVYHAFRSNDLWERSSAMEFLDALTSEERGDSAREIRELLRLAVEDLPPREKVERASAHLRALPAVEDAALWILVRHYDTSLATLAAYHVAELGHGELLEEAARAARERPLLADLASAVLGPVTPPEGPLVEP